MSGWVGTQDPVQKALGLERLGAALADVLGDEAWRAATGRLITGGKSNLTFEVTCPSGSVVVRRPPTGGVLPGAHDMRREAMVQQALAGTQVPVPRILLVDDGEIIGLPVYVMEKVDGHVVRDSLPEGYATSAYERTRLADGLVGSLIELHSINPSSVGLADYGRPSGFVERQVRLWARQWDLSKTHDVPQMDELRHRLSVDPPAPQRHSIVHGDFRMDNCILARAEPGAVAAVLDWELSTLGDPLTDFAQFLSYWKEPDDPRSTVIPNLTAEPGFPTRRHLTSRYAEHTELDMSDLPYYLGLAHFKFAAIVQGIAARSRAGAMAGQDFGDLDREVVMVAEQGLAALAGAH